MPDVAEEKTGKTEVRTISWWYRTEDLPNTKPTLYKVSYGRSEQNILVLMFITFTHTHKYFPGKSFIYLGILHVYAQRSL